MLVEYQTISFIRYYSLHQHNQIRNKIVVVKLIGSALYKNTEWFQNYEIIYEQTRFRQIRDENNFW